MQCLFPCVAVPAFAHNDTGEQVLPAGQIISKQSDFPWCFGNHRAIISVASHHSVQDQVFSLLGTYVVKRQPWYRVVLGEGAAQGGGKEVLWSQGNFSAE